MTRSSVPNEIEHALPRHGARHERLRLSRLAPCRVDDRRAADGRAAAIEGEQEPVGFRPEIQKIFRAMQRYGLIVADNGSDMYISGTFDTRWDNGILNPAFGALTASDFEVITRGWQPTGPNPPTNVRIVSGRRGEAWASPVRHASDFGLALGVLFFALRL